MNIKRLKTYILDEVKLYTYPSLGRLAERAVNGIPNADVAVSRKIISGKRDLSDWLSLKADEAKRRLYSISTLDRKVDGAGFTSMEEARAALLAVEGKLPAQYNGRFEQGNPPVLLGIHYQAFKGGSAYVVFALFLSRVGKGNRFYNIDFSRDTIQLFERAQQDNLIKELISRENVSTWVVFKDPILFLQERVDQLRLVLRKIL
jgi:hypothetical protein